MNLIEAIHQTTLEQGAIADLTAYETVTKYHALTAEQQVLINDFFSTLLGYDFIELLKKCDAEYKKPLKRIIHILWSIEDVQEIRPDLTDEQASHVLETIEQQHDAHFGTNWQTIEATCDALYPAEDLDLD